MNFKKIILEQILSEGRVEDAKSFVVKDFQDLLIPQSYKEGKKTPEWLQELIDNDPSGNQKYLMWALREIKKNHKFHPFDIPRPLIENLIEGINNFHILQDKLTKENIDKVISWKAVSNPTEFSISYGLPSRFFKFRYPIGYLEKIMKNPKDINSYEHFYLLFEITKALKQIPSKSDVKKEGLKLMDNEYWTLIVPLTHRASCSYGSGTRWCTTSNRDDTQFHRYQSNVSSLFYIIPKIKPVKNNYFLNYMDEEYDMSKIALHMNVESDLTFYDASDVEIDLEQITEMIGFTFGGESLGVFESVIIKAEDYHQSKLNKHFDGE